MKNTHFSVTLQMTPVWFEEDFLGGIYDFYKQMMWSIAVVGMPFKVQSERL